MNSIHNHNHGNNGYNHDSVRGNPRSGSTNQAIYHQGKGTTNFYQGGNPFVNNIISQILNLIIQLIRSLIEQLHAGPVSPPVTPPQTNLPVEFTDNRQRWENFTNDPNAFVQYTIQRSTFGPVDSNRPINVTEQGGQVTRATFADTGEDVPQNILNGLDTIDDVFQRLENAYNNNAERIDVTYDSQFGHPTSVFIDQSQMIADEEVGYTISNVAIALP